MIFLSRPDPFQRPAAATYPFRLGFLLISVPLSSSIAEADALLLYPPKVQPDPLDSSPPQIGLQLQVGVVLALPDSFKYPDSEYLEISLLFCPDFSSFLISFGWPMDPRMTLPRID